MTCQEYVERLLEGLSAEEAGADATAHEAECAACRERGASMRAALAGIAALPAGTPPRFAQGAMAKVAATQAPWAPAVPGFMERIAAWFVPVMGQLAAGVAVVVLGVLVFGSSKKSVVPVALAQITRSAGDVKYTNEGARTTVAVGVGYAQVALGQVADVTLREESRAVMVGASQVEVAAGEVQFDVHHDKVGAAGFQVVTPHGTVHVTGTEFMVRTDARETQVTLLRGSVRFEGRETIALKAGERLLATALFVRRITTTAAPAWPMLPTTAEAEVVRMPASRPAALTAGAAPSAESKPPPSPAAPVSGTALPEVTPDANVHEPFRP